MLMRGAYLGTALLRFSQAHIDEIVIGGSGAIIDTTVSVI